VINITLDDVEGETQSFKKLVLNPSLRSIDIVGSKFLMFCSLQSSSPTQSTSVRTFETFCYCNGVVIGSMYMLVIVDINKQVGFL
jgi:hypothetical protein